MLPEAKNHDLFEVFVAHHELLGGAGNVAIVVENAHAGVSGDVHLESDVGSHIEVGVDSLGRIDTH